MVDPAILVNGRPHSMPADGSLVQLLSRLGIEAGSDGVAVAINGDIVPKAEWAAQRLVPGDRVEVVRAVQGG